MTDEQPGFFAPGRSEGAYLPFRGRMTWRRLLTRLVLCAIMLVAVDALVAATATSQASFERDYRLPRTMPTADIADYADAIDASARSVAGGPVVLFLGASPTWGHRTKDAANTFPYAFRSAAASAGVDVRAFNLASNGQFVGDYLVIARRLAPDAEAVYVQLTYHTFNRAARGEAAIRYPELPKVLGVTLSSDDAALLRLSGSDTGLLAQGESWLGRYWRLWRARDAIDRALLGGRPRDALERLAARAAGDEVTSDEDVTGDGFAAFDSLEPEQQMMAVAAYAEDSSFDIEPADSEVRALDRLAALLEQGEVPAVFYMAPLNRELIRSYELIDEALYARNVEILRRVVEARGATFIDYNSGPVRFGPGLFADISHTTDAGGRVFGAALWNDTSATVTAVAR
ncbi:MAG: hypothetical protein Q7W16_02375 [Coriobacteriia bacterium]|nr:hypothetical protein [Coriobacteriia bacterium]